MTDKEIIQASKLVDKLRDAYNDYYDTSKSMPYDIDTTLRESAICLENALNEINRQQAEIERLQNDLAISRKETKRYATRRAEAIKEYKEKLREHAYLDSGITGFQEMVVDLSDIENIAEEMVGEANDNR
jgi:Fic family protein